jgi:hypothetical protein
MEVSDQFMPQPLYSQERDTFYTLNRELGDLQGHFDVLEKRKILLLLGMEP